jgi:hypothetical protein
MMVSHRFMSQQLSDVIVHLEDGVKDIRSIVTENSPKQLTLIDAIGNHKLIPFDFCFTHEVSIATAPYIISLNLLALYRGDSSLLQAPEITGPSVCRARRL